MKSKAIKDGSDIIALLDPASRKAALEDRMDYEQLKDLATNSNIADLVKATLQDVLKDRSSLTLYGRKINAVSVRKHISDL